MTIQLKHFSLTIILQGFLCQLPVHSNQSEYDISEEVKSELLLWLLLQAVTTSDIGEIAFISTSPDGSDVYIIII